jgi:ubiquinone/menaquinone biosynthesis C-methylase UbiE
MTLEEELLGGNTEFKGACCTFYEHDLIRILFGDSLHPGGLSLTKELGNKLRLSSKDKILDLASGLGTSAIFLAEEFGAEVVGIDLSQKNVNEANEVASRKKLTNVHFKVGDAEHLDFNDEEFDVVILECSFCLFPNKKLATQEIYRVLKREGRIGITDVAIEKKLPISAKNLLLRVACIADALPMEDYKELFENAGFSIKSLADRKDLVLDMMNGIKKRIFIAELAIGLKKIDLKKLDLKLAKHWLKEGDRLVKEGYGTYMVLLGEKL